LTSQLAALENHPIMVLIRPSTWPAMLDTALVTASHLAGDAFDVFPVGDQ
jgi:hypothetical protein